MIEKLLFKDICCEGHQGACIRDNLEALGGRKGKSTVHDNMSLNSDMFVSTSTPIVSGQQTNTKKPTRASQVCHTSSKLSRMSWYHAQEGVGAAKKELLMHTHA